MIPGKNMLVTDWATAEPIKVAYMEAVKNILIA
jgi:hypothetical protein